MADYRCYFVNSLDEIQGAESFDCTEDAEALLRAGRLAAAQSLDLEIWNGARLVGRLPRARAPQQ